MSDTVKELRRYYGSLLTDRNSYRTVADHLEAIALKLSEGLQQDVGSLYSQINNYHKRFLGKSREELLDIGISKEDCYQTVANEYGWISWEDLSKNCNCPYQKDFEEAVDALLSGDLILLKSMVERDASLLKKRSDYGHHATILHYVGSNGVEFWRQVVPDNLAELTQLLLDRGADPKATMNVYGGDFTTLQMLETSAHPHAAGVVEEVRAHLIT